MKPSPGQSAADRKVLFWYDPMRPDQHFDAPGKSPFMDMQLVPKYADEQPRDDARVRISPQMAQNLGMRTATVVRGDLNNRIEASGRIEADERSLRKVSVRAAGWVEVLNVRAEGDPVSQGELLAEVYSPALDAAQQEFLLALESGQSTLIDAARDKLRALGFADTDVARLERDRRATRRIGVRAPMHGYVMTLSTREGAAITPDVPLFELVGHDPLWILVNLPESQSALIAIGSTVEVRAAAYPGRDIQGLRRLPVSGTGHEHAHAPRAHRARQSRRCVASRHVRRRVAVRAIAGRRVAGAERSGDPHRPSRRGDRRRGTRRLSAGARRRRRRARRQNRHHVRARTKVTSS